MGSWLFVDGLSNSCTNEQLSELMAPFGEVVLAYVMCSRMGMPLGYGYVHMGTAQDAQRAFAAMDLKPLGNETLHLLLLSGAPEHSF